MKKVYLIIVVLMCQMVYSQQVLVPYRVKDKWGLSDVNGKMVVNADYDKIYLGNKYPDGYFGFLRGKETGVIYNKKELVSGRYKEIVVLENKLIITADSDDMGLPAPKDDAAYMEQKKRRNAVSLFNLAGKNLHPEGFKNVRAFDSLGSSSKHKGSTKYLLFMSENFDRQKSVFIYDVDKQAIVDQPMKDFYKLNLESDDNFPIRKFTIKGRETNVSEEMIYNFTVVNNKVKMESKRTEPVTRPGSEDYGSGSGDGGGYNDITIDAGDLDIGVEAPYDDGKKTFDIDMKVNGSTITMKSIEYPRQLNSTTGIIEKTIPLSYDLEWVKQERVYTTLKQGNGAKVNIKSVSSFKTKEGKYGIVFHDTLMIKPDYTYLMPFTTYSTYHDRLNFLVGKKEEKTGKIKYGTITINEKVIIPIVYDSIYFDNKRNDKNFVQSVGARRWNVIRDGKFGAVDIDGNTVLETVYDSIYQNKGHFMGFKNAGFTILAKDGKFGLYSEYAKEKIMIAPVFIKPPGYYIEDYHGQKGLVLYGLTDEEGKLFAYSRPDGFVYYKE